MTFQPILLSSGFSGYQFLKRTLEDQQQNFNNSTVNKRETEYFRENIGTIQTAQELVDDRRLLDVALRAFGLGEDINSKAFIEEVLREGTSDDTALASRLSDKRYTELSDAFGFGETLGPNTTLATQMEIVIERFEVQEFEVAVGEQDDSMRQALNAEREIVELAESTISNDAKWFTIMGNPPLRSVMEKALGLPTNFSQQNIDSQLSAFKDRATSVFGSDDVSIFLETENVDKLVRDFLVRDQLDQSSQTSPGSIALQLLQA